MSPIEVHLFINPLNIREVEAFTALLNVMSGAGIPQSIIEVNTEAVEKAVKKVGKTVKKLTAELAEVLPEETDPAEIEVNAAETVGEKQEPEIPLQAIRDLVGKHKNTHRQEMKDKLSALGAENVSTLDPAHYKNFFNFLNDL